MTPSTLPPRIVLFDGGCALCDRTVRWLLERDPAGRLCYAPLQGETAARLREGHSTIPPGIDTVVFLERVDDRERVYLHSRAVFRICRYLEGPSRRLGWLRVVPAPLSDLVYRLVAALRHRIAAGLEPMEPPPPEVKARFLP